MGKGTAEGFCLVNKVKGGENFGRVGFLRLGDGK